MIRFYFLFLFLWVAQLYAGLENKTECEDPCKKKIKESQTQKKITKIKTSSVEGKSYPEVPMDTKALKESLKERLMNRQTYNSKLEQIKSITSLEIERQSIQDLKSIQENQFQSIHSESSQPRSIRKEESFLLNEINENLKWKQK